MAKVQTQQIVISIHKLVKDNDVSDPNFISDEIVKSLEDVTSELINDESLVIEVELV